MRKNHQLPFQIDEQHNLYYKGHSNLVIKEASLTIKKQVIKYYRAATKSQEILHIWLITTTLILN